MRAAILLSAAFAAIVGATAANATAAIGGSDGFTPTTVIDFEQATGGSTINAYYATQGVTFATLYQNYAYGSLFLPDVSNGVGANFPTSNPSNNAVDFAINFSAPVANAAFALVTDQGATLTSYLGGVAVESVTYVGAFHPGADIVSFTNSSFDSIRFAGTGDHAVIIDNLGFTGGGTVPEPASWAMMIVGFGLVGAVARRRGTAVTA